MARKDQILQQEAEDFLCLSSNESEDDLSFWEFINQSDADSDDHDDVDEVSVNSLNDDDGLFVSWHSSLSSSSITQEKSHLDEEKSVIRFGYVEEHAYDMGNQYQEEADGYNDVGDSDDEDDDDDDNNNGYDLDDELVPWEVSGKLGRQRMRKLGKRAFAKMNYSKRSPFSYVKPGALRGKHGLGLKHSC